LKIFDRFIGIDWSGAESERQSGIQVFELSHKEKRPKPCTAPSGRKRWSRRDVFDFITSLSGCRALVGLDFAFSVPWDINAGYLPLCLEELAGARDLWKLIDILCKDVPHFYAGPIWLDETGPFRPFIHFWSEKRGEYKRAIEQACLFRRTEKLAKNHQELNNHSIRPASVYRLTGPQVGVGSFAGMRVLHALASTRSDIAIWPFDTIDKAAVVLIEIYPTIFYARAGRERPTKEKIKSGDHRQVVRHVLKSCEVDHEIEIPSRVDAIDAMVSAASIYSLSQQSQRFSIPHDEISVKEGWIFGVPFGDQS
jgi:hypothetical protein